MRVGQSPAACLRNTSESRQEEIDAFNRLNDPGAPHRDDWRAMVDCVLIDPDYDGRVFRIALSDVPERKADLVAGRYELAAGSGRQTVAVKIVDMLGEEVLVTHGID